MTQITVDPSLLVSHPPMLDETGQLIHEDIRILAGESMKQTALMEVLASTTYRAAMVADWDEAATVIADHLGESIFPIGSQFGIGWSTKSASNADAASYTPNMNVCRHTTGALEDSETLPVMLAQFDRCLPFDTQFSPYQAFMCAKDAMPAGTYNVTFAADAGSATEKGKTFQFTLTEAIPAGGRITGFEQYTGRSIKLYAADAKTVLETVTATEGSSGTSLGTLTVAGVAVPASGTPATTQSVTIDGTAYEYYGLNSIHRVSYGNNRWLHSPLRKYLNSSGFDWWSPATVFDVAPAYAGRNGFLSGFSEDFLDHVRPIARKTALNYITDGGTSAAPAYDTTYDLFTLPSGIEHFLADTAAFGGAEGKEGEQWDYWKRVAGSSSPLGWSTWGNESTYHPEYVQYDLASPTTARYVWMRSAYRGYGNTVAYVNSAGHCSYDYAIYGYRAAPACAIG